MGCVRLQVLTGVMVFVARDSSVQIAVGCLVNFAVLLANIALRPMADPVVRLARPTLPSLLCPHPPHSKRVRNPPHEDPTRVSSSNSDCRRAMADEAPGKAWQRSSS